jgi:predicted RNA-binding protein
MCLSTVVLHSAGIREPVMKEVARIEAQDNGFWLINLFGEKSFVEGTLRSIDLVDEHLVVFDRRK